MPDPVEVDAAIALRLRALTLEHPQLGLLNLRIVQAGGNPIPPRDPFAYNEPASQAVSSERLCV